MSVIDAPLRFPALRGMLSHDEIREELIRQLAAGEISAAHVAQALRIARPRVTEMKNRGRRVQPSEMEPLARLLGLTGEVTDSAFLLMPVRFPSVPVLTDILHGMIAGAGWPEIAGELAPRLAQRLPARLSQAQAHVPADPIQDDFPTGDTQSPAKSRRGLPPPLRNE